METTNNIVNFRNLNFVSWDLEAIFKEESFQFFDGQNGL